MKYAYDAYGNKTIKLFNDYLFVMFCRRLNLTIGGRRDRMIVGFTITCAISAYHH